MNINWKVFCEKPTLGVRNHILIKVVPKKLGYNPEWIFAIISTELYNKKWQLWKLKSPVKISVTACVIYEHDTKKQCTLEPSSPPF